MVTCKLCSGSPLTHKNSCYFGVYNSNIIGIICLLQILSFYWKFGKIQNISNERKRILKHLFRTWVFFFSFPVLFTLVFSYLIFFPLILMHLFPTFFPIPIQSISKSYSTYHFLVIHYLPILSIICRFDFLSLILVLFGRDLKDCLISTPLGVVSRTYLGNLFQRLITLRIFSSFSILI